ncbi:hypothetical protein [uncultured Kordia sp.]|uniref:hypothetical protein n=1 Tax=uncultured Kordia sp. TaxID=507699 RepID=UPI0026371653|nr:hypothetical protein [uncultured Kordia sp.]
MKKIITTLIFLLIVTTSFSQIRQGSQNFFVAKEWSKDISLFRCKAFLFQEVLGVSEAVKKFTVEPLAASKSGELTTLIYKSEDLGKEGLILGFYGNYWTNEGTAYKGYAFKDLNSKKAKLFLNKIRQAMDEHKKFLQSDNDNNNIFFRFEDMDVLIYRDGNFIIRVFWNGFDSTWENTAFKRSKKRFERKI